MFGLLNRTTSSASTHRSRPSADSIPSPTSTQASTSLAVTIEPSIDGPPSPGNIRAYAEQMKRGSILTSRSRSYTTSSATPSFRSGSSSAASAAGEPITLSRQSSRRSNASSMPSRSGENTESAQGFGKGLFSRTSRKLRRNAGSRSSSSLSTLSTNPSMLVEGQSAKDYYYENKQGSRRGTFSAATSTSSDGETRHNISGPYDFRHLTHTRHEQLPNLHRTSRMELAAEFSAIRASQAPTAGKLKGIRADDLHFKNFSSEAVNLSSAAEGESRPVTSHHRRERTRNGSIDETIRGLENVKSAENLRSTPPRPPRSPVTASNAVPPRTSSRTASMVWGNFDPLATTSLERPDTGTGFRKPKAFHLPIPTSLPPSLTRSDIAEEHFAPETRSPPKSPGPESWPLSAPFETFQLADVPEEEENLGASRRSRMSTASGELRASKSVPLFSTQTFAGRRSSVINNVRPETPPSRGHGDAGATTIGMVMTPSRPTVHVTHDSWEDDIDYCYEHEAEADCDYEWERRPAIDVPMADAINIGLGIASAEDRTRPDSHLEVPSSADIPDLSPLSHNSIESPELLTSGLLRPSHLRSVSHASSFKESHGFTLSPSLLIPSDFSIQMDQDALYDELLYNNQDHHPPLHAQSQFEPYPISPDDDPSSTASYRSSGFSRASASTTLSKSESQESVLLLSRAASIALQHRSISSTASVPDLIHSKRDTRDLELGLLVENLREPLLSSPGPLRRKTSMGLTLGSPIEHAEGVLTTVEESKVMPSPVIPGSGHGRKVSAPLQSIRSVEAPKAGRKRAMSAKSRTSYNLFPQI